MSSVAHKYCHFRLQVFVILFLLKVDHGLDKLLIVVVICWVIDSSLFYYTPPPTHRVGAILQSPCLSVRLSVRSHFRNRYLSFYWKKSFDIWLWHGDLYRVSAFQVYRTSTSCLPCDLQMNEWGYS